MPQTLSGFNAVLKEFYEPMSVSQIENKTRLLKSFAETDGPTVDGRRVVYPLHIGRNVGVQSSVEGATLPTAGRQNFVDVHIPLRKTVGRINLTKDVIDASRTNRGSFKRAMATEIEGLVRDVSDYRNEMLCGFGQGVVARISGTHAANATTITIDAPGNVAGTTNPNRFVQPSMRLALLNGSTFAVRGVYTVSTVTESGSYNQFVVAANTLTATDDDYLVRAPNTTSTTLSDMDWQNSVMGVLGLIDDGTYVQMIHGVNRQTYPVFRSFVLANTGALSLDAMQRVFDAAEMKGQGNITELWCEHGVRRAYLTLLEADRRYTSEKLLRPDGGTVAVRGKDIEFGGVPLKTERDFPYGILLGWDKDTLTRYVSVRGQWEDEDGNILSRSQDTHDFTGLWYMRDNFMCERPNANFRADGITTTSLAIHVD